MNRPSSAWQRLRGCLLAAIAYLATTWLSVWLLREVLVGMPTAVRAAVSLLPVVPIGFAIRETLRLVRAGDELQRRIDVEALATAALAVGLVCLSLGFMAGAGVFDVSGRAVLIWVFPALSVTYVLARVRAQGRYR